MLLLLRKTVAMLSLLLATAAAQSHAIRVEQECGLSNLPCSDVWELVMNGPSRLYYDDGEGGFVFSLAFANQAFVMTALQDNQVFDSLPFGLGLYPASGPIIPPDDGCDACEPGTAIAFLPMFYFPATAGQVLRLPIPAGAVPEPQGAVLMLAGLAGLGFAATLKGRHSRRPRPAAA